MQERSEFDEPDYALIDTLFSLAEAHLFMQARPLVAGSPPCSHLALRMPSGWYNLSQPTPLCQPRVTQAVPCIPQRRLWSLWNTHWDGDITHLLTFSAMCPINLSLCVMRVVIGC